eukprot:COSAG02_NODE_27481_length_608_cov_1.546169_1_plen_76_part_01
MSTRARYESRHAARGGAAEASVPVQRWQKRWCVPGPGDLRVHKWMKGTCVVVRNPLALYTLTESSSACCPSRPPPP